MNKNHVRNRAIKMAFENPHLRGKMIPLIQKLSGEDQGEEEEAKAGPSKKPGGKFIEFIKEMGDEKVRNPDTGNDVKLKSLGKTERGKALQHEKFEKWLASQEKSKGKSDEKGGKPPAKSEGTKDKGPDNKPSGGANAVNVSGPNAALTGAKGLKLVKKLIEDFPNNEGDWFLIESLEDNLFEFDQGTRKGDPSATTADVIKQSVSQFMDNAESEGISKEDAQKLVAEFDKWVSKTHFKPEAKPKAKFKPPSSKGKPQRKPEAKKDKAKRRKDIMKDKAKMKSKSLRKKTDEVAKKKENPSKKASLRAQVVKIAHDHPELRADLLPLLQKQAGLYPMPYGHKTRHGSFFLTAFALPPEDMEAFKASLDKEMQATSQRYWRFKVSIRLSEVKDGALIVWWGYDWRDAAQVWGEDEEGGSPSDDAAWEIQSGADEAIEKAARTHGYKPKRLDHSADVRGRRNAHKVAGGWPIDERAYDSLRKGDRVMVESSGGGTSGKHILEVGRTSYSKKYDVYTKKLYYIDENTDLPMTKSRVAWNMFKRMSWRGEVYDPPEVSLAQGDMGVAIKSFAKVR